MPAQIPSSGAMFPIAVDLHSTCGAENKCTAKSNRYQSDGPLLGDIYYQRWVHRWANGRSQQGIGCWRRQSIEFAGQINTEIFIANTTINCSDQILDTLYVVCKIDKIGVAWSRSSLPSPPKRSTSFVMSHRSYNLGLLGIWRKRS